MGLSTVGRQSIVILKSRVTGADASYPTAATDGVAVPSSAKGGITHILVYINGSAATVAAKVTVLGYMAFNSGEAGGGSGETDIRNKWYVLAQLNDATVIEDTTKTTVSPSGSDVQYAESLSHISMYDRIAVLVTDFTAVTDISVAAVFEAPI